MAAANCAAAVCAIRNPIRIISSRVQFPYACISLSLLLMCSDCEQIGACKVSYLSGYSCLSRLNSSSMVSRGLSLMSSMFSHPMTGTMCIQRCRCRSGDTCLQVKILTPVWKISFRLWEAC